MDDENNGSNLVEFYLNVRRERDAKRNKKRQRGKLTNIKIALQEIKKRNENIETYFENNKNDF